MSSSSGSLVASRVLDILLLFQEEKALTLSEIARRLELNQSTAYRLTTTLRTKGFLQRDKMKRYNLGPVLLKLARRVESDIRVVALPVMEDLANEMGESVYLTVSHDPRQYVCIEAVESRRHALTWSVDIGQVEPTYVGSAGKVHLSLRDEDEVHEALRHMDLKPYTPYTITDPNRLLDELAEIRRRGYALSYGERHEELVGISVPICPEARHPKLPVLSFFIPKHRFAQEMVHDHVEHLKRAAERIRQQIEP